MSDVETHEHDHGLGPVRHAHRFDEAALERWLLEHLPREIVDELRGPLDVRQFEGGQSNPTFRLAFGNTQLVLRKKPPGKLLPSAHAIEREFTVLRALASTDVPVPKPLVLCDDATVIGTPFYVMEHVAGRLFWNVTMPDATEAERRNVYRGFVETLAKIHGVDYAKVGLGDFGKPSAYLARQVQRWTQQLDASRTGPAPAMDALVAWLPQHVPTDEATSLIHGDFRVDNLMVSEDTQTVRAVLDWELSTLGHPLADLAHACMPYRLALPGGRGSLVHELPPGIPTEAELLDAYCARTGRAVPRDWPYFVAFVLFRMAAILQGVYARALQGNASSAQAVGYGAAVAVLAERACETVGIKI